MHLGLPQWQYAFTDIGLSPMSKQWFNLYAPVRKLLYFLFENKLTILSAGSARGGERICGIGGEEVTGGVVLGEVVNRGQYWGKVNRDGEQRGNIGGDIGGNIGGRNSPFPQVRLAIDDEQLGRTDHNTDADIVVADKNISIGEHN